MGETGTLQLSFCVGFDERLDYYYMLSDNMMMIESP